MTPLLSVRDLAVEFQTQHGVLRAVDRVDFDVHDGEFVGVVGESGSGKSVTALAIAGLLDRRAARLASGRIDFAGRDLLTLDARTMRKLRGPEIGMVFQDPLSSLNPAYTIGWQIGEAIRLHDRGRSSREIRSRVVSLLDSMGIPEPDLAFGRFPHEYSGGMRQRVMIAQAMVNRPRLLIADEPTTALDVTVQAQVMDLFRQIQREHGTAILLISHDLGLVATTVDRVIVMYGGRVMETGAATKVFDLPQHPYTAALLASLPGRGGDARRLATIPGQPPRRFVGAVESACPFEPRCTIGAGDPTCCSRRPALSPHGGDVGRLSACHHVDALAELASVPSVTVSEAARVESAAADPVLIVDELVKAYAGNRRISRSRGASPPAVDGVSFSIGPRETFALVGESGSGKSTTARMVAGLITPTSGRVRFLGDEIAPEVTGRTRDVRRGIQMVFQDPFASVNPRMRVRDVIAEPLRVNDYGPAAHIDVRVGELLDLVKLHPTRARQFPHELSGGERQRICVARAIALEPRLLILDEPVSSLDVSIQAQILNLLSDLRDALNLSYLFISHDLAVVRQVADHVAVMYRGKIVEQRAVHDIFGSPRHSYTRSLLAAIPDPERGRQNGTRAPALLGQPRLARGA